MSTAYHFEAGNARDFAYILHYDRYIIGKIGEGAHKTEGNIDESVRRICKRLQVWIFCEFAVTGIEERKKCAEFAEKAKKRAITDC